MKCCANHLAKLTVPLISRRQMLCRAGFGFGAWALLDVMARDRLLAAETPLQNPLTAQSPHVAARAKHVIFLFMQGGPSHIDTFDPKPLLNEFHGKPLPKSFIEGLSLQFTKMDAVCLGSPQTFTRCGESGIQIADTYPHLQTCAD